jgi:hypothetical protein
MLAKTTKLTTKSVFASNRYVNIVRPRQTGGPFLQHFLRIAVSSIVLLGPLASQSYAEINLFRGSLLSNKSCEADVSKLCPSQTGAALGDCAKKKEKQFSKVCLTTAKPHGGLTEVPPPLAIPECKKTIDKSCHGKDGDALLLCLIEIDESSYSAACRRQMTALLADATATIDKKLANKLPCKAEISQHCAGSISNKSTVKELYMCLSKHKDELSLPCRQDVEKKLEK